MYQPGTDPLSTDFTPDVLADVGLPMLPLEVLPLTVNMPRQSPRVDLMQVNTREFRLRLLETLAVLNS